MISLTQFRQYLLPIFRLMRDTGEHFEVAYKGSVYDVSVRKLDKVAKTSRPKRQRSHELVAVHTDLCANCGAVVFNGICMNSDCSAAAIPREDNSHDKQSHQAQGRVQAPTL